MTANKEYKHKERAERMYRYVRLHNGSRLSKYEIYKNVPGYEWHQQASDKCPAIRSDMKYVNANPEHDVLIVFDKQMYYAAMKSEHAIAYYKRKVRSLKTIIEELNVLRSKMDRDGQFSLFGTENGEVHVTYPDDAIDGGDGGADGE